MPPEPTDSRDDPSGRIHNPARYASLTVIRFFAASYVALYHTFPFVPHDHAGTALERFFYLGFTGVGLFFVLSGFILATVYPRLPNSRTRIRFWVARLARIYPMYILSVLLDVPRLLMFRIAKFGVMAGSAGLAFTLTAHVAMLQSWWPSLGGLNFPTWSLSTEAFFYFAFPFVIVPLSRLKSIGPLLCALAGTWVASLIVPLIVAPTDPSPSSFVQHLIGRNPVLRLPDFVAGILLAQLHRSLTASAADRRVWSAVLIAVGAVAFAVALTLTNVFGFLPFHNGLLMPVYCAVILGLALSPADSLVSTLFAKRLPILLGEASYSLYLLHMPLWLTFTAFAPAPNMPQYTAYFVLLVVVSIAALKFIELPLRVRILTWYDKRSVR